MIKFIKFYIGILLIFLILTTMSSCSSQKKIITTDKDLISVTQDFCKVMFKKQKKNKIYSCASAVSSDMELSVTKSTLLAKVKLAEKIISQINSKEEFTITDNNSGVTKDFQKISASIVNFDMSMYEIVEQKTIKHLNNFRTFTLLKLKV